MTGSTTPGRPLRRGRTPFGAEHGFTIVEMLVATLIMMTVTAGIFTVMNPAQGMFAAQPEVSDMQQRLRLGVEALNRDLLMAGAGRYAGSASGSLAQFFAPILPYRVGSQNPDPPATFRTDTITLMYVPPTAAQSTISKVKNVNNPNIFIQKDPGCHKNDDYCGFEKGMHGILIDPATGQYDTFVVSDHQGNSETKINIKGSDLNKSYGVGSYVMQLQTYTYYWDSQNNQLRDYDGYQTDSPVVDNVVGVSFEYYGDPMPATLRPQQTPPTTYGPAPPALGVDPADAWPAGENCTFMVSGGQQVPRMETLGAANGGLVKLDQSRFQDGPWCPDATWADRFDADALRIRKIRVTLRVQVANEAFRGPAGPLFTRGGTSQGGERYIPDQEIRFDVSPRNLNLGR